MKMTVFESLNTSSKFQLKIFIHNISKTLYTYTYYEITYVCLMKILIGLRRRPDFSSIHFNDNRTTQNEISKT